MSERVNSNGGDRGHAVVFGPTGGGKSTFLALLIAEMSRADRPDLKPRGAQP